MNQPDPTAATDFLPATYPEAAMRGGLWCKCPRCGKAPLFRKWLKPVERCAACGQDWSLQCADDFPAYVSIFVTGHLMAPFAVLLMVDWHLSLAATLAGVLPFAAVTMLGVLQPAKGAIIAAQWWLGLVGFRKERRPAAEPGGPA